MAQAKPVATPAGRPPSASLFSYLSVRGPQGARVCVAPCGRRCARAISQGVGICCLAVLLVHPSRRLSAVIALPS
eukprot:2634727-Pyramimonas_sp.AAC.1